MKKFELSNSETSNFSLKSLKYIFLVATLLINLGIKTDIDKVDQIKNLGKTTTQDVIQNTQSQVHDLLTKNAFYNQGYEDIYEFLSNWEKTFVNTFLDEFKGNYNEDLSVLLQSTEKNDNHFLTDLIVSVGISNGNKNQFDYDLYKKLIDNYIGEDSEKIVGKFVNFLYFHEFVVNAANTSEFHENNKLFALLFKIGFVGIDKISEPQKIKIIIGESGNYYLMSETQDGPKQIGFLDYQIFIDIQNKLFNITKYLFQLNNSSNIV